MAADGSGETADGFRPIKEQPPTVALPLKGYQLVGVNWLAFLHHRRLSGILADEMGLGKTCQVISFLANLYSQGREGPHLVVVPSSTLENWLREFDKFAPSVPIRSYYGNQRVELRADLEFEPDSFYVLITTYNMAVGKGDRKFLRHLNFKSMVLDEGHLVKNMVRVTPNLIRASRYYFFSRFRFRGQASSRYKELMRIKVIKPSDVP
ncbi:MAG: P-loop containing nucleoside triphosphate hydrolase protein [Olpidium bornovanus]|uniref:P-loop containing nucleoside triphosphate hydrolase protein n=1 Tax=Olpidium bornovanus TaxID=278681 RepID=A0A8H7ZWM3_9FUNG|nr:MAG: P-loop containing nucleoside triphosphate hydrolase protein [Olpidium bornovanus]